MMQLLMVLALTGVVSGSVSGAYWGGHDGLYLGASSGLTLSVMVWFLAGTVRHALHEHRINRYFTRDHADLEQ